MGESVLVDAGYIVALLSKSDEYHEWAALQAPRMAPPWLTCEAVLSEAFHLLGTRGSAALVSLLRRGAITLAFQLAGHVEPVVKLMQKYADVPMSLADACLVRMTETATDAVVLTTDKDFQIYRRLGRQVVPCVLPV